MKKKHKIESGADNTGIYWIVFEKKWFAWYPISEKFYTRKDLWEFTDGLKS